MGSKTFISNSRLRFITASIIASLFWLVFFYCSPHAFSATLAMILGVILFFEWKNIFPCSSKIFWFLLPFYPILPFCLLIYLNEHEAYRVLIYYLFVMVFSFDSGAYIVGTLIGSNPAIPKISPGKTVEGVIGGYLSSLVLFTWALWDQGNVLNFKIIAPFTAIVCLFAFLGDAFESILKRQACIKDSGNILPGHGGFLDRFDAVMMTSFFFFTFKDAIIKLFVS